MRPRRVVGSVRRPLLGLPLVREAPLAAGSLLLVVLADVGGKATALFEWLLVIVAVLVVGFGLLPAALDLMSRARPKTWVRPARRYLPRYVGLRSFVDRRKIQAPAILVRWRPPGWWWFSKVVLGFAYTS